MYRAVAYRDISEQHYEAHPYATRRAVSRMVRDGMIEEHEAAGPQGHTFTVLTTSSWSVSWMNAWDWRISSRNT